MNHEQRQAECKGLIHEEVETDRLWRDVMAETIEKLKKYDRVAITGGPRTGKSSLSTLLWRGQDTDFRLVHTDKYIPYGWESQPEMIIEAVRPFPRWVLEGVQVARALRRGLEADLVIYLEAPCVTLTKGQQAMAKGVRIVFDDWKTKSPSVSIIEVAGLWSEDLRSISEGGKAK